MKRPELKQKLLELLLQEADVYKVSPIIFEEFIQFSHTDIIVWIIYSWHRTQRATNATDILMMRVLLGNLISYSAIKDAWYRKTKALLSKRDMYKKYSYPHIYRTLYALAPCRPLIDSLLYIAYPQMKQIAAKYMLREGQKPRDVAIKTELSYTQVYKINTQNYDSQLN